MNDDTDVLAYVNTLIADVKTELAGLRIVLNERSSTQTKATADTQRRLDALSRRLDALEAA
jgi:hypothetical protein